MWLVGLLVFLVALGEILLRIVRARTMSYQFSHAQAPARVPGHRPRPASSSRCSIAPGPGLSVYCGLVGTGLMVIAAIYPIFRRIKVFRWLASNTMWFDFHMMAGTIGPMFIILHSALKLDTWVSAAFWSMVIVVDLGRARALSLHARAGARGWRRARGARSRARVPDGAAALPGRDGGDRSRARPSARDGAGRRAVAEPAPRDVAG